MPQTVYGSSLKLNKYAEYPRYTIPKRPSNVLRCSIFAVLYYHKLLKVELLLVFPPFSMCLFSLLIIQCFYIKLVTLQATKLTAPYPLLKLYIFLLSICPYLQKRCKPYAVQVTEVCIKFLSFLKKTFHVKHQKF